MMEILTEEEVFEDLEYYRPNDTTGGYLIPLISGQYEFKNYRSEKLRKTINDLLTIKISGI